MKPLSPRLLALVLISSVAKAEPPAPLRAGTVDMARLFSEYDKAHEEKKRLDLMVAQIQKESNDRMVAIREHVSDSESLQKQFDDPSLSDSKRQGIFQQLRLVREEGISLERERKEFVERRQRALQENQSQVMKVLLQEIRKKVEEAAKQENYDYVFDRTGLSSSQVPIILYAKDATDITESILKELNKDSPASNAGAPSPTTTADSKKSP